MNMYNSNSGYDYSRYWLGSIADALDIDDTDNRRKFGRRKVGGVDVIKLAGYQKAIANFVRITTGKSIPVTYTTTDQSYTDGAQVVLSSKIDDNLFDVTVGLALHEGAHILLSDFKLLKKLVEPSAGPLRKKGLDNRLSNILDSSIPGTRSIIRERIKDVLNIIEDRRIDHYIYTNAPGYRGYYQALYNHYFYADSIDIALKNRVNDIISWENYLFHIVNMTNANIQLDTLPKLKQIYDRIDIQNIDRLKSTADALSLAFDVCDILRDELLDVNTPSLPITSNITQQTASEVITRKLSQALSDNTTLDTESGNKSAADSTDSTDSTDTKNDAVRGSSDSDYKLTERELSQLRSDIIRQKDFTAGRIIKKSIDHDSKTELDAIVNTNLSIVDVNTASMPEYTGHQPMMSRVKCLVVNEITREFLESKTNPITANTTICHNAERALVYAKRGLKTDLEQNVKVITEGINLGRRLGKKLKLRNESNELNTTRLRHGKIDKRLIAEIGYGAEAVFSKLHNKTVNPISIHYSIDASGSMSGTKFKTAVRSAAAIAKAASMIEGVDVIISFRSTSHVGADMYPVMLIGYDSKKNQISHLTTMMSHIRAGGGTPEGLCFESVLDNMRKNIQGNKDGIFINISDGEPNFMYSASSQTYSGQYAELHTKKQVDIIRNMGYKVLSYFVSNDGKYDRPKPKLVAAFRKMYGKDVQFVDVNDINQLAATLNEVILRPVFINK